MLANELHHVGLFQHTAARRRLGLQTALILYAVGFNTQPPEGGWTNEPLYSDRLFLFQHTAARRRLVTPTDSMSKNCCFNTQPPEGGWRRFADGPVDVTMFQHTAARRRLGQLGRDGCAIGV